MPKLGFFSDKDNSGYGYEKFTYNGLNQLTGFEDEAGNKASYEYLSNGLRLSKTVNGAKTNFIWDGNNIDFTVTSDETVSYARAPGFMRTGTSKELIGTRNDKLYLFNGHGDVTGLTNKAGTVIKTYEYDAFGNEVNRDNNDTNPFRYCGEYWDNETESIYLRARYYNPSVGRFTAEDPVKDGLNWYAYCGGNPVMFWDPLGLDYIKVLVAPLIHQKYSQGCWAAALSTAIACINKNDVDLQDEIIREVEGIDENIANDQISDTMVSPKSMKNINDSLGVYIKENDANVYEDGTQPIYYKAFPDAKVMEDQNIKGDSLKSYIISEIDRGNPVILFYSNGADNNCEGHAVTVVGYEIKNGKMNVIYNDPGFEGNNIQRTAEIDQMKSQLPDSNLNLYGAYSIRENIKREENL